MTSKPQPVSDPISPLSVYKAISDNMHRVIKGASPAIRKMLAALVSNGHVLLEDFPGTGKTTLAKTLALSIDADYRRAQFTPDLLPSDIIGVSIFNQREQNFEFRKGPVFTNILLAHGLKQGGLCPC